MNVVIVCGVLARTPSVVRVADGCEVLSLSLTVAGPPPEAVPVVVADAPAWLRDLEPGAEISVSGRVRRRFFRAGGRLASPTEVVADTVVPTRQRARLARQRDGVVRRITGPVEP